MLAAGHHVHMCICIHLHMSVNTHRVLVLIANDRHVIYEYTIFFLLFLLFFFSFSSSSPFSSSSSLFIFFLLPSSLPLPFFTLFFYFLHPFAFVLQIKMKILRTRENSSILCNLFFDGHSYKHHLDQEILDKEFQQLLHVSY